TTPPARAGALRVGRRERRPSAKPRLLPARSACAAPSACLEHTPAPASADGPEGPVHGSRFGTMCPATAGDIGSGKGGLRMLFAIALAAADPAAFLAAVRAQDLAQVERMLSKEPSLAGARDEKGSAVSSALAARQGVGFMPRRDNRVLAAILK